MHRMGRESSETVQDPMVVALGRVPLFSALSLDDLETLATVTSIATARRGHGAHDRR